MKNPYSGAYRKPDITPPPSDGMPIYRESWLDKFLMGIFYIVIALILGFSIFCIYLLTSFHY